MVSGLYLCKCDRLNPALRHSWVHTNVFPKSWAKKMAEEDILWVDPRPDVVEEFNAYADEIMQTLVWSVKQLCESSVWVLHGF